MEWCYLERSVSVILQLPDPYKCVDTTELLESFSLVLVLYCADLRMLFMSLNTHLALPSLLCMSSFVLLFCVVMLPRYVKLSVWCSSSSLILKWAGASTLSVIVSVSFLLIRRPTCCLYVCSLLVFSWIWCCVWEQDRVIRKVQIDEDVVVFYWASEVVIEALD